MVGKLPNRLCTLATESVLFVAPTRQKAANLLSISSNWEEGIMGPLSGFKVIELAGIGPGPFCGMMLADMGAEVIRVERLTNSTQSSGTAPKDVLARNRRSIAVDLKSPQGVETVLRLVEGADALFEGFRPGVTERLGLGPEQCQARNERL